MAVPLAAVQLVLDLERDGHRLSLDGPDIFVEPAADAAVSTEHLALLKAWKRHVRMLITYTVDDRHLLSPSRLPVSGAHSHSAPTEKGR